MFFSGTVWCGKFCPVCLCGDTINYVNLILVKKLLSSVLVSKHACKHIYTCKSTLIIVKFLGSEAELSAKPLTWCIRIRVCKVLWSSLCCCHHPSYISLLSSGDDVYFKQENIWITNLSVYQYLVKQSKSQENCKIKSWCVPLNVWRYISPYTADQEHFFHLCSKWWRALQIPKDW